MTGESAPLHSSSTPGSPQVIKYRGEIGQETLFCLEDKSMTSHGGYTFLLYSLATPQSLSWTLKGFFMLTQRPFKGPLIRLVCCFQKYRDTRTWSGVAR